MISTSTIRVSVIIDDIHVEDAVRAVHQEFALGADAIFVEQGAG
jgi:aspartokinase